MHRIIFISALLATIGLGAFVVAGPVNVLEAHDSRTDHKKSDCRTKGDIFRENHRNVYPNCKVTPTPIPTTSTKPATTPTPGSTPSDDEGDGGDDTTVGERKIVYQGAWNAKSTAMGTVSSLPAAKWCTPADKKKTAATVYTWNDYLTQTGMKIQQGKYIYPNNNKGYASHYMISNIFTSGGDSGNWKDLVYARKYMSGLVQVYYRVSDSPTAVTDPNDSSWIKLPAVKPKQSSCKIQFGGAAKAFVSTYALNKEGKYFQYKVNISGQKQGLSIKEIVDWVRFSVEAIGDGGDGDGGDDDDIEGTPSPATSVTPSPTGTQTPSGRTGKITIQTKRIVNNATPSPAATKTPTVSPKPGNICLDNRDTEPAASVGLAIEQTAGGETLVEDQETDEDGIWRGIGGEIDEFATGTYKIEIGDLDNVDYKLVAICVTPDNNKHYLKTQTDPNTGHTTIFVVAGLETKVTALFAPRVKPFLTLSTYMLDGADLVAYKGGSPNPDNTPTPEPNKVSTTSTSGRKVLRIVYPGQKILYYIKWQNNGESTAKDVLIQDVIPSEFSITDDIEERYGVTLTISGEKRTISKKVGDVPKGAQGSIVFAATLREDAFDNAGPALDTLGGGTSLE